MALSQSILNKINQDKEDKKSKKSSSNGNSYYQSSADDQRGETGSSEYSASSNILERVALDLALKKQGFTHHRETGLLNDSRYEDYYKSISSVDDSYINRFMSDWNSYANRLKTAYDGMNWKSAQTWGLDKSYEDTGKDIMFRAAVIRSYLDSNKDVLDWNSYKMLTSQLDDIQKAKSEIDTAFTDSKKFYSQWKTEDEYNKWVKDTEEYEALKNFDTKNGEKEISHLESVLNEYQTLLRTMNGDNAQPRLKHIVSVYGGGDKLKSLISEKKQYLNRAKHLQEGITLSGVINNDDFKDSSGYSSTKNDGRWSKLTSDFGMGYDDLNYEYINGEENGNRQEIINKAVAYDADTEKFFVYDHMTEDQIAIYNYHYAKDGKKAAEKYLDSIRETLNYQAATERYSKMEGKTALELLFGFEAGVDQFQSGVKNLFNTEDDYIAQTATQMASGMVREDLADNGAKLPDWLGGGSLAQAGYDAITTTANMAPSIMTSAVANIIVPGSGAIVGNAMMFASSAGNAYQEALSLGYDKEQARTYSTLVGASEAGLQYLLGGISSLGGKVSGEWLTKVMSGVDNAFARFAIKFAGSMASEGFEEGLQEVLTPWFKNLVMHTDEEVNWSEVAYSTLLGALTAGVLEGPSSIATEVNTYRSGRKLQDANISAERLAEIGKTFSADTVAYQLAGRVNENTGAYTMGRLFNEIGATLTEQNVTEITEALVSKGMDQNTANKNAKALAYVVEGGQLSDKQIAVIESNEVLAEVARTTLIDANTTWNQRSKGYNEALMALAQEKASRTNSAKQTQDKVPASGTVDVQNKNGTESLSEAETVDTSPAKVKSISTIENGQVTVKLEDGTEVNVKKADLSTDDGVHIETIAQLEGISATDANFILNTLRTNTNASAQMDSLGAREAYKYGFYGFSQEHMTTHGVFSNSLTETQRQAIYDTGRAARQKQVDTKQATVSKKETVAKNATTTGKVHYEGDRNKLTERQSASLTAMERVAEVLGVQIYVFESELNERGKRVGANGWYDPKDSSIHIDLHAGTNGEGTMLFTLAHELTHHIRKWSPAKFKILADFLMQEYGKKGVNVDALVREQMAKAKRNGRTISYDTAYEEVVADSMEMMLSDGNIMKRLEKLKAQDKDLWYKIKSFIDDLAAKIRAAYKGMAPDSVEGRHVADMGKTIYRLQEMFAEALVDASENYQSSLTPGEEGIVVNENGDPIAYSNEDGSVMLSMRTYDESGRKELRNYLEKCVSSDKLTKEEMQDMMDDIEEIYQTCKEFKDKYAPFSSWSDAAVVRDTYGKPVFSVVTPNGDYKMNLDFSLVCKKRRTLDAVFNEMSKRGIIDDFELGQKSVVKINEIIRKHGLETACALCFVDAKRFRQASMADQFTSLYNELVLSLVPEDQRSSIDHFNFSGYETIKKVEDGIHKWDASKLDFSHLNEVMKNYGSGTVEHKAAKYIKSHAEGRKLLLRGDFMSSQGFDAVKTQNKDILKLYNSKKGTGGPKAAFGDVQYMNEIIKKARTWTPAKAYAVGGVRIQSFSDYVPRMVFDYVQMIYDLAATKLPAHAYTKESMFVKQFGLTGVKINMSLIPAIAEGGIAPGLDANGNYVWAGESFDFETAKEIQNAEGYTENCGTICVGVSDRHIRKLLSDLDIRMVIPYHKSGLNPIVAHMNKIAEFTDYTNKQNTTVKGTGAKAEKHFDFNKALHDMGENADPKAVIQQYFDWCDDNGYDPKFADFRDHPNYYKLIEDFTLYDKDGKYVPQRAVRAVFPKETDAFGSMKKLIESGLKEDAIIEGKKESSLSSIVDEIQNTLPRTEAEVAEEQVEQADRDLEELKLSDRDNVPTFYSHMAKVVDGVKQEKLGAASVVSMLRGKGVKAEEIKWSGIEDFLEGKKSVTKTELQEFIAGSMLQIEEDTLDYKERPYTEDQKKRLDEYEAKRNEVVSRVADEWKRITGEEFPVPNAGYDLESTVARKIIDTNLEHKRNSFEGRLLEKLRKDLQKVIENNDDFGFDSWRDALRSVYRHRKEFIKYYELSANEKAVIVKFCNALEAQNELPPKISEEDSDRLRAIARETAPWDRKIMEVMHEYNEEAAKHMPKWGGSRYNLKGGENYREILFRIPESDYTNEAMFTHWDDRSGILAHARIQDFNTFIGKMLFIEELQSDWHNDGHKDGYASEEQTVRERIADLSKQLDSLVDELMNADATRVHSINKKMDKIEAERERLEKKVESGQLAPDAPFSDTYHEHVLKRLIRMAAEEDYDSIGWTPAQIQVDRWSKKFAEGYRIEYDQDIPKFLNKYGKKWGTRVGKTTLDNGTEVWSMAITDSMKESVLTEGQPLYSFRGTNQDGIEVYETSNDVKKLPYKERQKQFLDIMTNEYRGRTAKFIRNGHAYYATFDEKDVNKNIYGDKRSDKKGWKAKINVGADGNIFELVENAKYNGSLPEKGKKITAHKGVGYWDYFIKNVQIDGIVFDLTANVRKKADGAFVYSIQLNENKKIKASPPLGLLSKALNGVTNASGINVSQPASNVNNNSSPHSDRDTESVSNRSLLANAFESVAQNDIERQRLQEYKGRIDLINAEERKLSELNEKIKDLSFSKGPKDTKAIRDFQFEAKQTANRISTYDKQLLRLEASKPLQDVLTREKRMAYQRAEKKGKEALEAYREKTMKTQRELIDKWQESRKKGIESRQKTAMRHKIKDVVNELNQYLLHGTKDRHVPIELQKAVAEALDAVNMDTVGAEERIAKLQAELMKAKTPEQIQEISRKIDHIREMGDNMSSRLKKLKVAYDEIINSDDPLIANSHDDGISAHMMKIIVRVGDTPLRDMSVEQLENVYDVYRMVLTTIRNANKAFKAKKSESISVIANKVMTEVEKTGGKKTLSRKGTEGIKSFAWNNLKPVYAFAHIGSDSFTEVFNNVRSGEDVWAADVTEAREFYLDKSKKHGYDSWDFKKRYKFTSSSGMDFELNLEQIMSLYAYSKREQAADHLKRGGIVIDETTEITVKNKLGIPVKFNPTEATAYNLSDETLASIISKLTDEQKSFVDEMQDYLSTVMGAKGNEVSLEMYGVKLFKEKFYFPLRSAQQFMAKAKEQQKGEVKIKNSGFSKETVHKASNPIVLTPFMNVWADHVNEMSMYHAFVLPMEDFYRVYNYKTPTSETMATESVEMFIQNAYGKGATKYIDQLLKDLNGGARTDHTAGIFNKMMGLFKKGAVFASMSVVVQQPSAIARAAALVDTKYFIGPKVDHKRHKLLWDEVKQYAPVAVIKEMGYFDTNMGKSTQDFILGKEYSGFTEKMKALFTDSGYRDEALSKAPALADEIAWCGIWEAVKRETKAKNPGMDVKSEAFLKKAGERFTEVIVKTQVYDSVLSRSGLMRSKDTGMKMVTAFMAEPTTSINMIADALLQGKRGSRKYSRSTIGAVIASQILNSILVSFVYAGRDDDEDETYAEKYIGTLTGEVLDSMNPAGYIPFIKDIMSIVQGYDVERSDMAVISDLWKAWENLSKDNISPYRKVEGFAGSIAQIFGLPVKNIMRDARGIYQTIDSFVNGQQTTKAGIGYAVKSALPAWAGGGDVSNQEQLYAAYINGDAVHRSRVESRYKDQKAINSAMRSAIKEHFLAGDIDADTAVQYMVDYCSDEKDEAFWKVEEWKYKNDAEEAFSKFNEFYGAVQTGKDLKAVIKKYTDNGVTTGTLKEQITEYFKPLYIEMTTSEKAGIKGYLLNAMTLLGEDRADAEEKISKWEFEADSGFDYENRRELFLNGKITGDQVRNAVMTFGGKTAEEADKEVEKLLFEAEYGFAYSDRADAYKSGEISAEELKHILMTAGGKTAEEADLQVQAYDWEAEGHESVTTAAVRDYAEYCATVNVPKDVFLNIRSFSNNTSNDVDANGKTIYYSAMKKIMAEINAQYGLTDAQKDALARSMGWAEKNIQKYKLW